ncbi:MAG: hypothetical protein LBU60_02220 [Clostridiales bacterium]|nr:hypothetical protein [Clostridiales bacterium]
MQNKLVTGLLELMVLIILFVLVLIGSMLILGHFVYAVDWFVWGVFALVILEIIKCILEILFKKK